METTKRYETGPWRNLPGKTSVVLCDWHAETWNEKVEEGGGLWEDTPKIGRVLRELKRGRCERCEVIDAIQANCGGVKTLRRRGG